MSRSSDVKKSIYAILGGLMILAAALIRSLADGGSELVLLLVLGLMLLIASADLPESKRSAR